MKMCTGSELGMFCCRGFHLVLVQRLDCLFVDPKIKCSNERVLLGKAVISKITAFTAAKLGRKAKI